MDVDTLHIFRLMKLSMMNCATIDSMKKICYTHQHRLSTTFSND